MTNSDVEQIIEEYRDAYLATGSGDSIEVKRGQGWFALSYQRADELLPEVTNEKGEVIFWTEVLWYRTMIRPNRAEAELPSEEDLDRFRLVAHAIAEERNRCAKKADEIAATFLAGAELLESPELIANARAQGIAATFVAAEIRAGAEGEGEALSRTCGSGERLIGDGELSGATVAGLLAQLPRWVQEGLVIEVPSPSCRPFHDSRFVIRARTRETIHLRVEVDGEDYPFLRFDLELRAILEELQRLLQEEYDRPGECVADHARAGEG